MKPSNVTALAHASDLSSAPSPKIVDRQVNGNAFTDDAAMAILTDLRDELDAVDARLLEDLRQRLDCCCRIGRHKKLHSIPMMQPQRIGVVQQRAASFAREHGIRAAFVHALYEIIIEETCRLEDEIIGIETPRA